jgi:hypothetical protein
MKKHFNLKNLLILVLGVILLLKFTTCNDKPKAPGNIIKVDGKKYEVVKHEIDTLEVIKTQVKWKKGDSIPFEVIVHDTIPQDIDTLSILKDFYAKAVYYDTLVLDDSLGWVAITDTISKNRILGREITSKIKERLVKETTIVKELPKRQVFIGANTGFTKAQFLNSVGGGLIYKDKKDALYQINLGMVNTGPQLSPYLSFGVYWKISLKK